jgi:hypothetical protein
MVKWRESNVYPFSYNLPSTISFPDYFWKDVIGVYKDTLKDGLERAVSVFWVDGELVVTSIVKGDEKSVKSNHNLNVKYSPHPTRRGYLRKEVYLNEKLLKRKDVYHKNVPKKVVVEYLFNMHTHPKNSNTETVSYSFFSKQDVSSLLSSGAIISGLVTDRLWLLVRTSESPSSPVLEDEQISVETLKDQMKFTIYEAEFNNKAIRK